MNVEDLQEVLIFRRYTTFNNKAEWRILRSRYEKLIVIRGFSRTSKVGVKIIQQPDDQKNQLYYSLGKKNENI